MSAADWTGFGSGSAWLSGLWVSVFGVSCGVWIVGLRLWCLGCDGEVVTLLFRFYFFLLLMALITGTAIPSMIAKRNDVSQSKAP